MAQKMPPGFFMKRMGNKKLTKSGIKAVLTPYRWLIVLAIVLFVSAIG